MITFFCFDGGNVNLLRFTARDFMWRVKFNLLRATSFPNLFFHPLRKGSYQLNWNWAKNSSDPEIATYMKAGHSFYKDLRWMMHPFLSIFSELQRLHLKLVSRYIWLPINHFYLLELSILFFTEKEEWIRLFLKKLLPSDGIPVNT